MCYQLAMSCQSYKYIHPFCSFSLCPSLLRESPLTKQTEKYFLSCSVDRSFRNYFPVPTIIFMPNMPLLIIHYPSYFFGRSIYYRRCRIVDLDGQILDLFNHNEKPKKKKEKKSLACSLNCLLISTKKGKITSFL